jgi:TP901 family phage tail tape measure protein
MSDLGSALFRFLGDRSQLDSVWDSVERDNTSWAQRLSSGITGAITTAVTGAVVAATGALTGLAAGGLNAFIGFERQMNEVFTLIPGASQQAMGQMSEDVKAFALEFGTLPSEVIPALYEALSAGVPQGTVFDFLGTAEKAAIGGVTSVKTAVDGLTSVTNAYGTDVLSVDQASDQMFKAVAYGKTNFEQLSASLYNVTPTAAGLGISFDQVAAALAALTLQGVPTSVATTQLRQLFIELSKAGTDTSDTFTRISGQGFQDFIASGHTVQDALTLMEAAAKQSGVGISDLFGSVEAGAAALTLTGQGTANFTGALDAMQNSAGATDAAYAQMDQGLGRSIDRIKASFEVLLDNVGAKLGPAFAVFADWINANMPQISDVVMRVFDAIGSAISMVLPFFSAFVQGVQQAFGIFIELGSAAMQWGQNIGQQLANGLMSAAGSVVDSLGYLGDLITYWLQPHSPPKLLPHLDQWGTDAANVYMAGWGEADFGVFDKVGSTIEGLLKGLVDTGTLPEDGYIPMLLGSREAVAAALNELRTTGSVSESAFRAVRDSAGAAGEQVDDYFRSMVALEEVNRKAAAAQAELNAITKKYDAILSPLEEQLAAIEDAQQAVQDKAEEERLLKLIGSVGGKESDREAARLELEALRLRQKIRETKEAQQTEESAAQTQVDAAAEARAALEADLALQEKRIAAQQKQNSLIQQQIDLISKAMGSGGGGGGGAAMDDAAKKAEAASRAQRDYNFAVADTDTKLAMLKEDQAKYTQGDAEYWRLQGQIAGLEKQRQQELDASSDAQQDYARSLQDTEAKIASLKEEQSQYAVGSADYNRIQKEIDKAEKDRSKQLEEVEKKNQEAQRAERDYQYAIADTGGKLDILRGELANTTEGSADYWRIKTQVNALEVQQQHELDATSKAMGGAHKATGGLAAGVGNISGMLPSLNKGLADTSTATTGAGDAASTTSEQYADMKDRQQEAADAVGDSVAPLSLFQQMLATVAPYIDAVKGALLGIGTLLVGMNLASLLGSVGTALAAIVSPVGLLVAGAAALGIAWQTNFAGIRDVTAEVFTAVMDVIGPAISLVVSWFEEKGPDIVAFWTTTWETIEGIVSSVLDAVGTVITTVLGAVQTFIATHGDQIKGFFTTAWDTVKTVITGVLFVIKNFIVPVLTEIAAFISRNQDAIVRFISGAWDLISGIVGGALEIIRGIVNVFMGLFSGDWDLMWDGVLQIFQGIWDAIKGVVSGALDIILSTLELAWSALGSAVYLAWNALVDIIGAAWNAILLVIGTALAVVVTGISVAWDAVSAVFIAAWDTISGFFTGIWDKIGGDVISGLGVVGTAIGDAWTSVSNFFTTIWTSIGTFFSGIWTSLSTDVSNGVGVVKTWIESTWNSVATFFSTTWNTISTTFSGIWTSISDTVSTAVGTVQTAIQTAWDTVAGVFSTTWDTIKTTFEGVWTGITDGVSTAVGLVEKTIGDAWDRITTATSNLFDDIGTGIGAAFDGVVGIMKGIVNSAIDVVNGVIGGLNDVSNALGFGNAIDPIPHLAKGGMTPDGLVRMGENGLERVQGRGIDVLAGNGLYNVPAGLKVTPADKTAAGLMNLPAAAAGRGAMQTSSSGNTYYITVDARGATNPAEVEAAALRAAQKLIADLEARIKTLLLYKRGS